LMNREDAKVSRAVRKAIPAIAQAIDILAERLSRGGSLFFVGSGTSGRIGALDAAECPPTFGTDPAMVQYVIAGGDSALAHATEASEDSPDLGRKDIAAPKPRRRDVVVGLSASGRTPYTVAALRYAKQKGAATIAIACNAGSELALEADVAIEVEVGPEVLTGSTRLKAATAEKMICNMLTTGAMARQGYVFDNLMVHLPLKNQKLLQRGISVVMRIAGVDRAEALETLNAADNKVSVALVMLSASLTKAQAVSRLKRTKGNVRIAIAGKAVPR